MKMVAILYLVLLPVTLLAHGGGLSLKQEVGEHVLFLDAVSIVVESGNSERVNFEIAPKEGTGTVPFSHVWVRMTSPGGDVLFAGNIVAAAPGFVTGFSYVFPREGIYAVAVRFYNNEQLIAENEFALPVEARTRARLPWWVAPALLLVAGFVLGRVMYRKRK